MADNQKLITISSTWSTASTFSRHPELYARLLDEAGEDVRVAAVLHPNIATVHGRWQVHSWLAAAKRKGLLIVPPEEGWRAVMIASDHVIGDHGSTTSYAAAIGQPAHLATFPDNDIREQCVAATLASVAPRLDHGQPLLPQLTDATTDASRVAAAVSGRPGLASVLLRAVMYGLLKLPEPSWPPPVSPVPLPRPADWR